MQTAEIIHEISNLPAYNRMLIVEQIVHSIRMDNQKANLEKAADYLYNDYKNDRDLTTFAQLDSEHFYGRQRCQSPV